MIDAAQLDVQARVDLYLSKRMSEEETASFEAYMLEHPEVLDDVDIARRLKLGLATLRSKGELPGLLANPTVSTRPRFLAMAASVLLVASLGAWYLVHRGIATSPILGASLEAFAAELRPSAGNTELIFVRTRAGELRQLEVPARPSLVMLRFLPGIPGTDSAYQVELLRDADSEDPVALQRLDQLHVDADGYVSIYFDAHAAGRGLYRMRLSSMGASEEYLLELK